MAENSPQDIPFSSSTFSGYPEDVLFKKKVTGYPEDSYDKSESETPKFFSFLDSVLYYTPTWTPPSQSFSSER